MLKRAQWISCLLVAVHIKSFILQKYLIIEKHAGVGM